MFTCSSGNVFIGSIDTTEEQKDAYYICNALGGYIKTIRVNNIVQICINNASNMKSAADLIIYRFPILYFQGYVAYCLDLLLGKSSMGEMNYEKGESCCFFYTTKPCTTSNILSL